MSENIRPYDGAVNGMSILHGIAVLAKPDPKPAAARSPAPDLESVIHRAVEVIGSRDRAMRWLGTPVRALDYATPIALLHDRQGQEKVLAVLTQLEHGVL